MFYFSRSFNVDIFEIALVQNIQVREGGYDQKVNEIGQKTWGIMKGVMAIASQKVEEYTKEGGISNWKGDNWQNNYNTQNGHYQNFGQGSKGFDNNSFKNHSNRNYSSVSSWDDWDDKNQKEEPNNKNGNHGGDNWAGWDDVKNESDNGYYNESSASKDIGHKSGSLWAEGGFV
ncbi:ADP-ribosylation factor GTPase-activating protein AGD7-like [Asparagus officinalis]|uniref:ADP-ribosylation factor GTPase-activating protein AGD7-like n=1 Tax=Asparagus officinalis TaxID=4686 RepID=UPI00098E1F32|nr:ADP-ribosylation factor GTPase-activating protein AGD7-like [Asparagus officinalis]